MVIFHGFLVNVYQAGLVPSPRVPRLKPRLNQIYACLAAALLFGAFRGFQLYQAVVGWDSDGSIGLIQLKIAKSNWMASWLGIKKVGFKQ